MHRSRERLAKTGVLAQRRKPPRSSWYFEEGKNPQEFMFTDTTEVKPLKQLKENDNRPQLLPQGHRRNLQEGHLEPWLAPCSYLVWVKLGKSS
ncbi:hypothetical protein BSL78_02778 [Apostichopus japonicus]|uniref:Uncharacterized protein n=1 Tax=Stichopus japonicus TaxID=307972 RepID=A0A2G8LJ92_STIJA|nr:hypothetical protein BSL78_02778 [Apostichopus japonicus]